jgi:uncharacterized protein (DUF1778 family)
MAMARTKDARLEVRLSQEQTELLRWAAASRGVSMSAFVLDAAIERAERIRALEHVTALAPEQQDAFVAWLAAPASRVSEMERLAEAKPFENR